MDRIQYLTFPKNKDVNAIVGNTDQMMKIIKINSGIYHFEVNRKRYEQSIKCWGSPSALKNAQKLLDNELKYPWENGLYKYLDDPHWYPDDIQFEDKKIVVTIDCFPKAKYHFLIIVQDRSIAGMFMYPTCIFMLTTWKIDVTKLTPEPKMLELLLHMKTIASYFMDDIPKV